MAARNVSKQTQKNWWIDAGLLLTGVVATLTGIYFLFLPTNGFQGGRNSYHNIIILFARHTWEDLHIWGGIAMTLAVIIHITIHWSWVASTFRKTWREFTGRGVCINKRGRWNLSLNFVEAVSFAITAVTGVYLLLVPGGKGLLDPMILFSRTTWDLAHTWAAIVLVLAILVHFAIHWRWVTKVARRMFGLSPTQPKPQEPLMAVEI